MTTINRPYVYLDLGFYGPCNLKCTYCRSEIIHDDGTTSIEDLRRILDAFRSRHRAAVVKTSGYGEVTIWQHFGEALDLMLARFPVVQVITNGAFGRRPLDALLDRPTVTPNLTIDGHTLAMNRLRVGRHNSVHRRILENLRLLTNGGKRVEVNCVLHDQNVRHLPEFCDYLAEHFLGRLMLFPFPARSFSLAAGIGQSLASHVPESLDLLEELSVTYRSLLPPPPYMDDLCRFVRRGTRNTPCQVHWLNAGCGTRRERLFCANYGEDLAYGPIASLEPEVAARIALSEAEHAASGRVGPRCDHCFNHFHVLDAYLDGRLTLEGLMQVPSLAFDSVKGILVEVKSMFDIEQRRIGTPSDADGRPWRG